MNASDPNLMVSHGVMSARSPHPFAQTVQRLLATLTAHGLKIFATIDQSAEAAAVGLTLRPTTLILFGSPKAGTPLMAAAPSSAIDLPLKVLVTEQAPGTVTVSFNASTYILERHSIQESFLGNLAPAERLIMAALAN